MVQLGTSLSNYQTCFMGSDQRLFATHYLRHRLTLFKNFSLIQKAYVALLILLR